MITVSSISSDKNHFHINNHDKFGHVILKRCPCQYRITIMSGLTILYLYCVLDITHASGEELKNVKSLPKDRGQHDQKSSLELLAQVS
jgi:hypothetical protein